MKVRLHKKLDATLFKPENWKALLTENGSEYIEADLDLEHLFINLFREFGSDTICKKFQSQLDLYFDELAAKEQSI